MSFHLERERKLEQALRKLVKAARAAVVAEERYGHWSGFGTNSTRAQSAERRRDEALARLDAAETAAQEALDWA